MLDTVLHYLQPILKYGVLGIYLFSLFTVAVYGIHRYFVVPDWPVPTEVTVDVADRLYPAHGHGR